MRLLSLKSETTNQSTTQLINKILKKFNIENNEKVKTAKNSENCENSENNGGFVNGLQTDVVPH